MSDYQLWLLNAFGTRVAAIPNDQITKLSYTLTANAVGAMTLTTGRDALPDAYVTADARLEIWRRPDGGSWHREGEGPWFIQKDTRGLSDRDGSRYRTIMAEPAITLIERRHVMYYAGSAPHSGVINAVADGALYQIMNYNVGPVADINPVWQNIAPSLPTRVLADSLLTIPATWPTSGPLITKQFAWRNVLGVLQEIARDSAQKGTVLYFDIVDVGGTLTFQTWIGVRGVDRSSGTQRLVVSAERGSLGGTIEVVQDWSNMATVVIAGGQGQGSARTIGYAYDSSRVALSAYGEREFFLDATTLSNADSLNAEANAKLQSMRPAKVLTGNLISVPGAVYGLDWGFGDRVVAEFEGDSFTARVDSVTVTLDRGQETVTAAIRGET